MYRLYSISRIYNPISIIFVASKKKRKSSVTQTRHQSKLLKVDQTKSITQKDNDASTSVRPVSPPINNSITPLTTNLSRFKQHKLNFATTLTTTLGASSIYQLKQRSIDLNLRGFHSYSKTNIEDYGKDYLRQIGIYLKGNYNIKRISSKYNKAASNTNRRSTRNTSINTSSNSTQSTSDKSKIGSILSGYVRCYLEDYMSLKEKSSI